MEVITIGKNVRGMHMYFHLKIFKHVYVPQKDKYNLGWL